ncbi:MAG: DEAD/DEAH box helicase [Bacteroidetes bacterium]|nr:MAG: DEAD/DEAH box helicase [Bacteroidota bacterium]
MESLSSTLQDTLNKLNIKALNAMQTAALEGFNSASDLVLLSPTGSGKTLAFLLPLVPQLMAAGFNTKAMVVVPSRELAMQIESVVKSLGLGFKVTCCYGGHKREIEENNLLQPPALLIGTPGRLADHLRRGSIQFPAIETLVLDEFDKSLELGFLEEMSYILSMLTSIKKRILTSATNLEVIPDFVGLQAPLRLDFLADKANTEAGLAIQVLHCHSTEKFESLFRLICMLGNRSAIVFCNHRDTVERTSEQLKAHDIVNVFYHGAMEQRDRDAALCKFRNGTANVLVTTDLASRGLDIANIRYIIHYHLPATEAIFTHRNGRTARMDASGTAILMVGTGEYLPPYLAGTVEEIVLPPETIVPEKPKWTTLFIAAGKKEKVNKIDIVGFFGNKGRLKKEDIGIIEVKDNFSFVGVKKAKVSALLEAIKNEKIKNKKVLIAVAK